MTNRQGTVQEPETTYRAIRPYKLLIYTGNDLHISLLGALEENFSFGYHSAQEKATGELPQYLSLSLFPFPIPLEGILQYNVMIVCMEVPGIRMTV